jgi:DNA repair exonuclease SbcCD ATPase subunit
VRFFRRREPRSFVTADNSQRVPPMPPPWTADTPSQVQVSPGRRGRELAAIDELLIANQFRLGIEGVRELIDRAERVEADWNAWKHAADEGLKVIRTCEQERDQARTKLKELDEALDEVQQQRDGLERECNLRAESNGELLDQIEKAEAELAQLRAKKSAAPVSEDEMDDLRTRLLTAEESLARWNERAYENDRITAAWKQRAEQAEADIERLGTLLADAMTALIDLGACDGPECVEPACLRVLPRLRAEFAARAEQRGSAEAERSCRRRK